MTDQPKLSEEYKNKIAIKAIEDITNLAKLHNISEEIIMTKGPMRSFIIAVYQAGSKIAMDEMNKIVKKLVNKTENISF